MRIAVFGLGYVGCVSAACFAKEGHQIIGVDVNAEKVAIINSGKSPIVEPGLGDLVEEVVASGRLRATTDYREAVQNSDISLICVGTPSAKSGQVILDYIYRVGEQIGDALRDVDQFHVAVIRSTVLPGTVKRLMQIIESHSGKKSGTDFGACSNPEFLREGSAIHDFYHPPYTVIGPSDEKSGEYISEIYKTLDAPLISTDVGVAEILKYANNSFHALKVVFANEMGTICKAEGVDSHKLMEIFVQDTKLNLSPYYLRPGFAFGGSCLPKDVKATAYRAKERDLDLPILSSIMSSNDAHIRRTIDLITSQGKKKIGILGISFKGDTDDLRESPMVEVVETLIGKGYDLKIYDRNVHLAKLFGANKEYISDKIPHISNLMVEDIEELLQNVELIIIGNNNKEFGEILQNKDHGLPIIDLSGIPRKIREKQKNYQGLCW